MKKLPMISEGMVLGCRPSSPRPAARRRRRRMRTPKIDGMTPAEYREKAE